MTISFKALSKDYFPKLEFWLNTPHVNYWYGETKNWTIEMVSSKYNSYCHDLKNISEQSKPINSFIICFDENPIGYIQYYNAYEFPRDGYELNNLPHSLAAIDMYIGDEKYLGKSIGRKALELFLENHVFAEYDYALVDPDINNLKAISCFEKSSFADFKILHNKLLMVAAKRDFRISTLDIIAIEVSFRKNWLPDDSLWIFGSRVNPNKKGGDIDIYIETNAKTIDQAFSMKQNFLIDLVNNIGEQKIDIVLNMLNFSHNKDIFLVARNKGIKII